ncbi:hypothetical protein PBY51_022716 [Eleginops maclovinus]|uniref:Uncharacterized protein n=1 Tax=Eleginops maclovinus TaxID=56733 RepID=A0AAN7XIG0_ELEMC|nr:hypothetical protein PBY51_022716 [Eleginops maclovinus]
MCKHISCTSERYHRSRKPIRPSGTAATGSPGQASLQPAKNTRGLPTPAAGQHHTTKARKGDSLHHS